MCAQVGCDKHPWDISLAAELAEQHRLPALAAVGAHGLCARHSREWIEAVARGQIGEKHVAAPAGVQVAAQRVRRQDTRQRTARINTMIAGTRELQARVEHELDARERELAARRRGRQPRAEPEREWRWNEGTRRYEPDGRPDEGDLNPAFIRMMYERIGVQFGHDNTAATPERSPIGGP
jgi:hypothetical protein